MFMTGSGMENADQGRNLGSSGDTILVVAKADLFSECMVEALAKKFPNCDVASITSTKPMLEKDTGDMKLVLFYHIPGPELHEALQAVRENHPETSIGLVVEAIDMLETYVSRLVEARIIDGVLPLNLRLDVFMAAVDLLMKGGEHFPSALLNRLTNKNAQLEPSLYQTKSVDAARSNALKLRRDSISALTTREVQILDLICKGTQNKIIADKLHLSENTVKVHVRNIYKKMNVRNRTEAASRFFNEHPAGEDDMSGRWRN
ncbi:response regulator transcription factor [Rhizobium laguerreae]|jgi:DNA-binding NarL/FixJ family response regulator|uniref:DNA-binding NarL/FixJ family response regulator n=1 Tax=Rhizobium laguerreae TaxID=1076926 RepID=A0AAJ3AA46_9HYPH|nr:response regulator transcription factor [Rhizobium laguerreae]MBN9981043.1 response regulator transcription factor [Rhizobium laguerreae]MBY3062733.1 response regulator transcription factor [Rhizobium laguerreae]MBY3072805.1 response regulator transcription factor [Rhizobium laguerreae]MBY3076885.1 response regulator transcription factor [Rhizobium laguerreae]MBY3085231.1 response regulator transcription factor [Rhizobium laguerreae]